MASVTPRRSTRIQAKSPPSTSSASALKQDTSNIMPTTVMNKRTSPLQPTTLEAILLAIYPTTLILGSLFSLINADARSAPSNSTSTSHAPHLAPSYFARKNNLFNQIFVKRGWFWITTSYFLFLFTHASTGPSYSPTITLKRIRGALRWGVVTIWWIFVTQWFFGPAIIDRGFTLTGGQCELVRQAEEGEIFMDDKRQLVTSLACKTVGGKWKGGHDISGHVFLLVLGSMFLLEEVLHVVLRSSKAKEERTISMSDGAVKSAEIEAQSSEADVLETSANWDLGVKVVLSISGLSLWMLLMTAAYFHTWFEKFTGLLVAFSGIFIVYFLPRAVPVWRNVIGLPGI